MRVKEPMPERPRPRYDGPPPLRYADPIIARLRQNGIVVSIYTWLTDTLVPLVLAVVIVAPVGAVLLLFYLPKFYRNAWRRKHYGVEVIAVSDQRIFPPNPV